MAGNNLLNEAKQNKNDEFYTTIEDIEHELRHYKEFFKDKIVFCNCDDPEYSNFWKYFQLNFYHLGLKKLISTHFEETRPSYKLEIVSTDSDGQIGVPEYIKTPLSQNGDFRSPECVEILKEADVVVTNPPFSKFRSYIAQLVEHDKKFLVIANMSTLHYKEIFPLIRDNKIWSGYGFNLSMVFKTPYENKLEANRKFVISRGYDPDDNYIKKPGIVWLTNIDIEKRHEDLLLYKTYEGNESEYPKYDNFDAINVNKVSDIPVDYYGIMGVPDTILGCHNPDQFEIIGIGSGELAKEIGVTKNYRGRTDIAYTDNGKPKCPYSRILIRRK